MDENGGRAGTSRCLWRKSQAYCRLAAFPSPLRNAQGKIFSVVLHQAGWLVALASAGVTNPCLPPGDGSPTENKKETWERAKRARGLRFGITKMEKIGISLNAGRRSKGRPMHRCCHSHGRFVREEMLMKGRSKYYKRKRHRITARKSCFVGTRSDREPAPELVLSRVPSRITWGGD